jgi:NADH-quinone oxidoreductase subunit G
LASELQTGLFTTVPRDGESDGLLISADRNPNTTGAKLVWQSQDPAGPLFAIREGVRSGSIKALLVLGEELADAGFTAEDLAKPEFIASIQLLAGPTAEASDVILPGAAFAEKRGSMVNVTGRLQRLNRAVEPLGEAKDDWEILRDLVLALQGAKPSDGPAAIEDVFKAMAANVPEFAELSLSKIGDLGKPVVETGVTIPLLENERARKAAGLING